MNERSKPALCATKSRPSSRASISRATSAKVGAPSTISLLMPVSASM
jgi:hypothetical protein